MNKFNRVLLALPLMALAILPARAQVTIDVSKITCEQYVLFTVADPHDIAMWLSGYYNSRRPTTPLYDYPAIQGNTPKGDGILPEELKTPSWRRWKKCWG